MTKVLKEEAAMLELSLLASIAPCLNPLVFCNGLRAFFKRSFRKKVEPVSPEHLYRIYIDSRRTICNVIIVIIPVLLSYGSRFYEDWKGILQVM